MERRRKESKPEELRVAVDAVNEAVVIASVVADPEARRRYLNLPVDYFHGTGHAEMWAALQELYRRGLEYSSEAIRSVASPGSFDAEVLDEYVRARPAPAANVAHHVERLRWEKTRVEVARGVLPLFLDAFRSPSADGDRVKSLARQLGQAFGAAGDMRYLRTAKMVAKAHAPELRSRRLGQAVYPFGIPGLDDYGPDDKREVKRDGQTVVKSLAGRARMVPGLYPGMLTVMTGLSGSGKTTATARMVLAQAARGRKTLWGAWEQSSDMTLELAAVLSLGFSRTDFMEGRYAEEDEREVLEEMERFDGRVEFFELPFGRSRGERGEYLNDRNLDLIHQYVAERRPDVFIADVFRYALYDQGPKDETLAIARMLGVAAECRTHVVLINHLNLKDVERRPDKRPTRDAVFGSSSWINTADNVVAAHLPAKYHTAGDPFKMELHVLKQRYGDWPLAVEFDWDAEYGEILGGQTLEVNKPGEQSSFDAFVDGGEAPHDQGARPSKPWNRRRRR